MVKKNMPVIYGRDLCEWALTLFRTVAAGGIIAIIIGGFNFYTDFKAFAQTVSQLEKRIDTGILPQADKLIAELAQMVRQNRHDIDRHDNILRGP